MGTGVPDLPLGYDNYRFGGGKTHTIRLPINMIRTLQSQHHVSSSYQSCTHDWPHHEGLSLPTNRRTQERIR